MQTKQVVSKHVRFACQASLAVLLSACGSGSEQPAVTATDANGSVSVSAAQLADDSTTTLSIAQATGAGLVPVQTPIEPDSSESVDIATDIPTIAAAQASEPSQNSVPVASPVATSESQQTSATDSAAEINEQAEPEQAQQSAAESTQSPETEPTQPSATETVEEPSVALVQEPVQGPEPEQEQVTQQEPQQVPAQESAQEPAQQPASESLAANEPASTAQKKFISNNTDGFEGEVLDDGVVKVTWQKDPTARGYNFYRGGEYITTVFGEEYLDKDTFDESYYYEVQAFDYDENYNYIAKGLTVEVSGTGRVNPDSPKPKENILDGYELVFSDEFNGSELDSSKWVTQYLWGDALVINSEEQHYVDILNKPDFGFNPFSFDGESITISSIRTPNNLLEKANGQKYLSGVMTSYDAFKFTYGYVETRAQLPFGKGLWPAFWLLNAYYVDDKPEIDIMEFIGDNQDTVYHTYHYYDSDGNLRSTESEGTKGKDWTNGWHTYAVEWLPGQLIFYVDGIEEHRVIDSKVSQQEMYILANTALGGWWPGSPDDTTNFPAEYKIDYIRAYQKADSALLADPNEGRPSQLLLWDDVPNVSPNHIPPFELWPQGYPERQ